MSISAPTSRDFTAFDIVRLALRRRKILIATTKVELHKKYAGSVLGPIWIVLFPMLLLGIYLFIYAVVFPVRVNQFTPIEFSLYIFAGLIPYLGLVEVLGTGTMAVKQNIHLVKNVMMPIELIPLRSTIVGVVGETVSLGVLVILLAIHGSLTWHVLWLPIVFALQILFLAGLVYFCSALAVSLPDMSYFISLLLMLLMFVSPIGYRPETLSGWYRLMVDLNPVSYMIEIFRDCLFFGQLPTLRTALVYAVICLATFVAGASFFIRFKSILIDYE